MEDKKELRIFDSKVNSLSEIFSASYTVDFYQREYVWQKKQIEDLISDLTIEFLKNWKPEHDTTVTGEYDPQVELYFSQNILAQSLCEKKYTNSPGFKNFIEKSSLDIHAYDYYTRDSIT